MRKISPSIFATRLAAMRSVCREGEGRVSELFLVDGKCMYDPRRNRTLVEAMARYYAVDLVALRQRCGQLLHGRNYLPLPLSSEVVLVPLALGQGGEKTGYINLLSVRVVRAKGRYSEVVLEGGVVVECFLAATSVHNRFIRAQLALREMEIMGMLSLPRDRMWRHKLDLIRAVLED